MALKLFRSTGYSSILVPGETRLPMHPSWLILLVSLWVGFVCNVGLWRELRSLPQGPGMAKALLVSALLAASCLALLSLLGWRRTLKRAATMLLLLAALVAACIWVQALPLDARLLDQGLRRLLLPGWPSLLRWQFPVILLAAGILPMFWIWHVQVRRLPGPEQLSSNAIGMTAGLTVAAVAAWLLLGRA